MDVTRQGEDDLVDSDHENVRVTVQEAADRLGVTEDAIRKRIRRGTLRSEKNPQDGRVYVFMDVSYDTDPDTGQELVGELREQVHYLREQLRREQDAHGEARRIIAALTSRIPQLEASQETQNEPESAEPRSDRGTAPGEATEPESRSWWQRWFGG